MLTPNLASSGRATPNYRQGQFLETTGDRTTTRALLEAGGQSKADASSDCNRDLPKTRAARHMSECFLRLIERKRSIDDGLHSVDAYCIRHRLEIFDRSNGDALQALLLQHYERKAQFGRRRASEHADERDGAADPGRPDRLIEGTDPSHFHDEIYALPGQFPRLPSPIGRVLVVERDIGAEASEPLDLGVARGGRDDARPAHLRKLKREEGYTAGTLRQNSPARFHATELDHRAPGREPGAG